jgi:hypothetical protein
MATAFIARVYAHRRIVIVDAGKHNCYYAYEPERLVRLKVHRAIKLREAKPYILLCIFAVNYLKARTKMERLIAIAFDFIKCFYL